MTTGSNNGLLVPDAVNSVICVPDDVWRNQAKHVERFTDKINCVYLHLAGYLLTQNYVALSHEHKIQICYEDVYMLFLNYVL